MASTLKDPRFPSVQTDELPELRLEISLLDPHVAIGNIDEFDHLQHGIIVRQGLNHGLFLPQVEREEGGQGKDVRDGLLKSPPANRCMERSQDAAGSIQCGSVW